jgi:hypothetical protein
MLSNVVYVIIRIILASSKLVTQEEKEKEKVRK